jgi:hypothetical protein
MTRTGTARRVACVVAMCAAVLVPASVASASGVSIKAAIQSYESRILTSEGRVVTALGEYKTSNNPSGVVAALKHATAVLEGLESKIAKQSAGSLRIKRAKSKIESGLHAVVTAYRRLENAFNVKSVSQETATAEAKKALEAVKRGGRQLREGAKLLG